ncbi:MAG: hypothetical protein QNJ36_14715 [Calothrix sp. MO_167.B42]|nr:hypothetical protein [Calothrix sp. MO_167.B42]
MPRRLRRSQTPDNFNIWTSFTDLMSNAFMVLTLLLLLTMSKIPSFNRQKKLQQPKDNQQKIIVLPAEEYKFASGSAELPDNLSQDIQTNPHDGKILKAIKQQLDNAQKK